MNEEHEITWDGKNLAKFQMMRPGRKPVDGVQFISVDEDWNLQIDGLDIPVGAAIGYDEYRWWRVP